MCQLPRSLHPLPSFRAISFILALAALFTLVTTSVEAQTVDPIVMNNADSGADSLRAAIAAATPDSTITFDSSLSGDTIRLTSGELLIQKNLTIDASSLEVPITISGDKDDSGTPTAGDSRVFAISLSGTTVDLNSLIITEGFETNHGGGIIMYSDVNLTIQNTTIVGNSTSDTNGYTGGGIYSSPGSTLMIVNSTIVDNRASSRDFSSAGQVGAGGGGGISSEGATMTVRNSTITGNYAGSANNGGDGNSRGGDGGGINAGNGVSLTVENSTIVGNYAGIASVDGVGTATQGEGGGIDNGPSSAPMTISNSIVAGNIAGNSGPGNDIYIWVDNPPIITSGHNLIGNNDTVATEFPDPTTPGEPNINGDLVGTPGSPLSPQLQPLADNGGRTQTLMPYFDSIVVNAGVAADRPQDSTDVNWNLNLTELLPLDQTGAPRVSGDELDIGAFEYQAHPIQGEPVATSPEKTAALMKIAKLKKKIKKLKKKDKKAKVKKLNAKLKKLQKKLAGL